MTHEIPKIDHAIADILIVDGDRFLLVEEGRAGREGRFNIPGGHVEPTETLVDAALREAQEETGYIVELTGVVGVYQSIYEHINVSGVMFSARIIGGEPASSSEHPSLKWVTKDELDELVQQGGLWTKYPPYAIADYIRRGVYPLDVVVSYDFRQDA